MGACARLVARPTGTKKLSEADLRAYQAEKAALQRLLELTGTARNTALDQLEQTEPQLAQVVKRRLMLAEVPAYPPAPCAEPPVIARYQLQGEIGRGGMGRVWLAVRADGADQQRLAIKQIRSDALDAQALRRFEAERRALARLDHPNIIPLLDTGTDSTGAPYLVTPFVEGESIRSYCDNHALDLRARVQLLYQVASALAHAHQQLIVHRDLKPGNILVEPPSANQPARVRLLDFGIAKLLDADTEATATGASLMTLRYAAPEQLREGAHGPSCDLYALGVLAYELLSGTSPYGDLREPAALIQAIAEHTPAPLQRMASGTAIPPELSALVLKLLRKQPADRYPSAEAVLAEFDRWLQGEPLRVMRGQRHYQMQIWLRRRWPWLAAAAGVMLLLGLHLYSMDQQLQVAERERRKASEVADFMITLFQSARPSDTSAGVISALDLLKLASTRLLQSEGEKLSPEGRAALLVNTGHAFYQMDEQATARPLFAKAAEIYAQTPGSSAQAHAEALRFVAMSHYAQGNYQEALSSIGAALTVLQLAGDSDSKELGSVLNSRCLYLSSLAQHGENGRCHQELLAYYRAKGPLNRQSMPALINIAAFEIAQGAPERGEALLREVQAVVGAEPPESFGNDLPIVLQRHLATSLREQARYSEAITLFQQVIVDSKRYEGGESRGLLPAYTGLSATLTLSGQLAAAEAPIREALRLAATAYPPAHRNTLNVRLEFARWLLSSGKLQNALDELEQIQQLRQQQKPLDESGDALTRATLAHVRCRLGDSAAALTQFAALAPLLQQPGMASRQRLAQAMQWRAQCH